MCMARQASACLARSMYLMEPAQGDAARGSCRVARAVESGLQGRRSCVCTRAVVHRAGGEQSVKHAAGQGEILAAAQALPTESVQCSHSFFTPERLDLRMAA